MLRRDVSARSPRRFSRGEGKMQSICLKELGGCDSHSRMKTAERITLPGARLAGFGLAALSYLAAVFRGR